MSYPSSHISNHHPSSSNKGVKKGKRRPASRNIILFIFCLLISVLMWLVISLQKNYQTVITIPFDYSQWDERYVTEADLPREISVEIEDKGLVLLSRQLFSHPRPIPLTLSKKQIKRGTFTVTTTELKRLVQEQLSSSTRIRDISPQSINLALNKRHEKEVLISPRITVQPANGFRLVSISTEPASISIFGSKKTVDAVKAVYTDTLTLNNLSKNKKLHINLMPIDGITLSENEVAVEVHIEELTEQTFELPITLLNVPENVHLRALPGRAQLTITLPLSSFGKISEEEFELAVDWNDIDPSDSSSLLPIQVIKKAEEVDRYRLTPEKIQYIIEEKKESK